MKLSLAVLLSVAAATAAFSQNIVQPTGPLSNDTGCLVQGLDLHRLVSVLSVMLSSPVSTILSTVWQGSGHHIDSKGTV